MTPIVRVEAFRSATGVEVVLSVRALDQTYSLAMSIAAAESLHANLTSALDSAKRILRGGK